MTLALFFNGSMSMDRLTNIHHKADGKTPYEKVVKRRDWISYLDKHTVSQESYESIDKHAVDLWLDTPENFAEILSRKFQS